MITLLTSEELEAQLRANDPTDWWRWHNAASDTLADLRRQRDEARAECAQWLETVIETGEIAEDVVVKHILARGAAERALAEARHVIAAARQLLADGEPGDALDILDADDALPSGEAPVTRHEREIFVRQLAEANAECERQRERAEKWQFAAEIERTRCAEAVYDYDAHRTILALPTPTIEPSVTDTEKAND